MKVKSLHIQGIGAIEDLKLTFNDNFNIICGPNGVGKTTILECIGHSFSSQNSSYIRRNATRESGQWELGITHSVNEASTHHAVFTRRNFHPDEKESQTDLVLYNNSGKMIVFKTNRSFNYIRVSAVTQDQPRSDNYQLGGFASDGVNADDAKFWLINRFLWSAHKNVLTEIQLENLNLALSLFGALDDNVQFSRVKVETFDVMLKLKSGAEIYYEYLSSGYKSVLFVLLGLIKEIEYRFPSKFLIKDFDGVIVIDEMDLHLHPQWQAKLVTLMKNTFPNAQIIATSHSPHMIQAAEPNELIPLGFSDNGQIVIRDVPSSEYGFQGWTVEEILTDVMGMSSVYSEVYKETLSNFENALEEDSFEKAKMTYEKLDKMLHPNNHLRKLLKLQMSSLGE